MKHEQQQQDTRQNCPYLWANHKACYCVDITSSTVRDAIRYCGTYYLDCPILQDLNVWSRAMQRPESSMYDNENRSRQSRRERRQP